MLLFLVSIVQSIITLQDFLQYETSTVTTFTDATLERFLKNEASIFFKKNDFVSKKQNTKRRSLKSKFYAYIKDQKCKSKNLNQIKLDLPRTAIYFTKEIRLGFNGDSEQLTKQKLMMSNIMCAFDFFLSKNEMDTRYTQGMLYPLLVLYSKDLYTINNIKSIDFIEKTNFTYMVKTYTNGTKTKDMIKKKSIYTTDDLGLEKFINFENVLDEKYFYKILYYFYKTNIISKYNIKDYMENGKNLILSQESWLCSQSDIYNYFDATLLTEVMDDILQKQPTLIKEERRRREGNFFIFSTQEIMYSKLGEFFNYFDFSPRTINFFDYLPEDPRYFSKLNIATHAMALYVTLFVSNGNNPHTLIHDIFFIVDKLYDNNLDPNVLVATYLTTLRSEIKDYFKIHVLNYIKKYIKNNSDINIEKMKSDVSNGSMFKKTHISHLLKNILKESDTMLNPLGKRMDHSFDKNTFQRIYKDIKKF